MTNNTKTPSVPDILVVDDRRENLVALEALLDGCDVSIIMASSGNEALSLMLEKEFALVLLDVQMPGMDGFEVAELMRGNAATQDLPIIFITAINKEQVHIFKGYESGAVDYLSKPIEPLVLRSKVNIFLELWRKQNELARAVADLEEANRQILSQQEELRELSVRDPLTGLYQRRWFDEVANKEVSQAVRHKLPLSLAMIDIDHFKRVNDDHGHDTGDAVLIQVANGLGDTIRVTDTVFRFGGEEFVVLLPHTDIAAATMVCERIRTSVADAVFQHDSSELHITISIGVVGLFELETPTINALVECADKLLYRAKSEGRNRVCKNSNAGTKTNEHGDSFTPAHSPRG